MKYVDQRRCLSKGQGVSKAMDLTIDIHFAHTVARS